MDENQDFSDFEFEHEEPLFSPPSLHSEFEQACRSIYELHGRDSVEFHEAVYHSLIRGLVKIDSNSLMVHRKAGFQFAVRNPIDQQIYLLFGLRERETEPNVFDIVTFTGSTKTQSVKSDEKFSSSSSHDKKDDEKVRKHCNLATHLASISPSSKKRMTDQIHPQFLEHEKFSPLNTALRTMFEELGFFHSLDTIRKTTKINVPALNHAFICFVESYLIQHDGKFEDIIHQFFRCHLHIPITVSFLVELDWSGVVSLMECLTDYHEIFRFNSSCDNKSPQNIKNRFPFQAERMCLIPLKKFHSKWNSVLEPLDKTQCIDFSMYNVIVVDPETEELCSFVSSSLGRMDNATILLDTDLRRDIECQFHLFNHLFYKRDVEEDGDAFPTMFSSSSSPVPSTSSSTSSSSSSSSFSSSSLSCSFSSSNIRSSSTPPLNGV